MVVRSDDSTRSSCVDNRTTWILSLTKRCSEADCLSRIVLTHAPRQATGSLIFDVRSISSRFIKMHRQTTRYRSPAGEAQWTGSARIFASRRIDWLGLVASPCSPGEQTGRPDPTPTKQIGAGSRSNSFLRISGFGCGVDAQSARMTSEFRKNTQSPNKAMVPTPVSVTILAGARIAPLTSAAHLHR